MARREPDAALLDARTARIMALIQEDAPELIGAASARHLDEIRVSPEVASWITGRSARAIRQAVDDGELPAIGRRKRWIALPDLGEWSGTPISGEALAAMLERSRTACSRIDRFRDRPGDGDDIGARDRDIPPRRHGIATLVAGMERRAQEIARGDL